jgi:sulfate adenylyltransferase subunit 1 (EFTu-like GTPase family)
MSALKGDNGGTRHSQPWFSGPCLLEHMESVDTANRRALVPYGGTAGIASDQNFRGFAGQPDPAN